MPDFLRYTQIVFKRFKAFKSFTLRLGPMNIMVGPNNAGKSTILAAFRILEAGLRKARTRKATLVEGPAGSRYGYSVDFTALSIAEENIFFNYEESEPASVVFSLTQGKRLTLHFPENRVCHLFADDPKRQIRTPSAFKTAFNCPIGFVPILGPVEHEETLYKEEAARLALFNYRAARNFRNIWHHFPEDFDLFRQLLRDTWPGMDIQKPDPPPILGPPTLHMFCTEERITREIAWIGFGFQVWCQMLTHIVKSRHSSLFLIDEPDIYLHSDLQRRLLNVLRKLGPDILVATHSTELVSEADANEIVLIDKSVNRATRIKKPTQLPEVFSSLGSHLNPVLTRLAKSRRAVFVEGKEFPIISKFARRLRSKYPADLDDFAVLPLEGFNPDRVPLLKAGIRHALGDDVRTGIVLDRDFRSDEECDAIQAKCETFCDFMFILTCKEIESLLLVPDAIDRAARQLLAENARRTGQSTKYVAQCSTVLDAFIDGKKHHVESRFIASYQRFVHGAAPRKADATTTERALEAFESEWAKGARRRRELVPAKAALSAINQHLQDNYSVNVSATSIISAMHVDEIPSEMRRLLNKLAEFVAA